MVTVTKTDLTGRKVYFKLTKANQKQLTSYEQNDITSCFTVGKLYTVIVHNKGDKGVTILDNNDELCYVTLSPRSCAYLYDIKGWSVKLSATSEKNYRVTNPVNIKFAKNQGNL